MQATTNFFTGIAQKFAALIIVLAVAGGLSACGQTDSKQAGNKSPEKVTEMADTGLREAISIEAELRAEQIYLGVSDYMRADALSGVRMKASSAADADVLRWYGKINQYKKNMLNAIHATDQRMFYYSGPITDLTDRRDTAAAFATELKTEMQNRGIRN